MVCLKTFHTKLIGATNVTRLYHEIFIFFTNPGELTQPKFEIKSVQNLRGKGYYFRVVEGPVRAR